MTELEKKQSGEFYDTQNAKIRTVHNREKERMKRYNNIPGSDTEQRENLLRIMLGSSRNVMDRLFLVSGYKTTAIKISTEPVHIGKYVWIGGGTVILLGVTIGDYAAIGAESVVTKV